MIQLLISATEIICSRRTNPDLDLVFGVCRFDYSTDEQNIVWDQA